MTPEHPHPHPQSRRWYSYSAGILLIELTTRTLGLTRSRQLPRVPDDCPQVTNAWPG